MEKRYILYHVPTFSESQSHFSIYSKCKNIYPFLYFQINAKSSTYTGYGKQVIPDIKDMISSCLSGSFTAGLLQTVPVSTQATEGPCLKVMSAPGRKR